MAQQLNQQLIRQARVADLSQFLLDQFPDAVKVSGSSIWLKDRTYVCTKKGYCGYVDYHTNETGNSIDFLVTYLNFTFRDAVLATFFAWRAALLASSLFATFDHSTALSAKVRA